MRRPRGISCGPLQRQLCAGFLSAPGSQMPWSCQGLATGNTTRFFLAFDMDLVVLATVQPLLSCYPKLLPLLAESLHSQ